MQQDAQANATDMLELVDEPDLDDDPVGAVADDPPPPFSDAPFEAVEDDAFSDDDDSDEDPFGDGDHHK